MIDAQAAVVDHVTRHVQRQENGAQDPQDWWRAVRTGIKDLLRRGKVRKEEIRSIGVTGDDYGLVCVSREGLALNNVHLSPHDDLIPYADAFTEAFGARNMINLVGGPAFNACSASLADWIKDHQPRHWHDCAAIMNPRGFLNYRLSGQNICDPSTAAAMRMYNPRSNGWSKMVLDRLNIPAAWLPEVHPGPRLGGRVTPVAARETGLSPGTPIAVGANRTASIAIAAGGVEPGMGILELGGNGHLSVITDSWQKPKPETMEISCHTVNKCWALIMRGIGNDRHIRWHNDEMAATDVQQWRRAGRSAMEAIAELAAEAPPGSDNLHFISHRDGGGLVGLRPGHQRRHVLRAMLESVGYTVRRAITELKDIGVTLPGLHLIGEGAESHLWCQIIADVCGLETHSIDRPHAALVGAGILAGAAIGVHKTPAAMAKKLPAKSRSFQPRRAAAEVYDAQSSTHQRLQELLPTILHQEAEEAP
ncbi:MAG: hypothetical protein EA402_11385 [Planctomycetota bacterium]|nr:MAG: hypothetical protein EA402_11385 [Planctomycetota bacterium]